MAQNPERIDEPEEKEDLVSLVTKRYDLASKAMLSYLREAEECRLYYRGDQWLAPSGTRWVVPSKKPWKVRLTINRLLPAVESILNVVLRSRPMIIATPASDEDADRNSAKLTEKVLRFYWDELDMDRKLEELTRWLCVAGNAFLRVRWDRDGGEKVPRTEPRPVEDENGPVFDEMGSPKMEDFVAEEIPEGAPVVEVLPPFSFSPEPGATTVDDAAWFIVTEVLLKQEVQKMFPGVELKDDNQDRTNQTTEHPRSYTPFTLDGDTIENEDRIEVFQMYEKPNAKHPNGRLVYTTQHTELSVQDLPKGEYRIVQFKCIDLPGEFWGTSYVSQSVPAQTQYNKLRSQMIEHRRLMGNPKWTAPVGSINTDQIDSDPGQIIFFDVAAAKGIPPSPHPGVPVSASQFQEVTMAADEINDLMSRHEASQGDSVGQINSGVQARAFQAADNGRFGPFIRGLEHGLVEFARNLVATLQENLTTDRVVMVTGRNHKHEAVRFNEQSLSSRANVRFEIESQLPWQREGQRQQLFWMYSQGLVSKEDLLMRIQMPSDASSYETEQTHRVNAQKENALLSSLYFPCVETDNHAIHIEEHAAQINLPENRERIIQYWAQTLTVPPPPPPMPAMPGMGMGVPDMGMGMGMPMGMPPAPPAPPAQPVGQRPPDILNVLRHLEDHRNAMPPPPPPPAQTKLALTGQLPPEEAMRISQSTVASANAPTPSSEEPQAQPQGGTATPPGGMSGETYLSPEADIPGPSMGGEVLE